MNFGRNTAMLIGMLAMSLLAVASGCTLNDSSGGPYEKDASGKDTYKGEDVSKYHPKREGGGEDTSPPSPDVCPLPPAAEKDALDTLKVGDKFPEFTLKDVCTGKDVKRSEQAKGLYQLIIVWASWCPVCRSEAKSSVKPLYDELGQGNTAKIAILAVGVNYIGDTAEAQRTFVESNKYGWTCVFDANAEVKEAIGSNYIPTAVLVDESGKIVTYGYYSEGYAKKLNSYLRAACEFKEKHPDK